MELVLSLHLLLGTYSLGYRAFCPTIYNKIEAIKSTLIERYPASSFETNIHLLEISIRLVNKENDVVQPQEFENFLIYQRNHFYLASLNQNLTQKHLYFGNEWLTGLWRYQLDQGMLWPSRVCVGWTHCGSGGWFNYTVFYRNNGPSSVRYYAKTCGSHHSVFCAKQLVKYVEGAEIQTQFVTSTKKNGVFSNLCVHLPSISCLISTQSVSVML